MSHAANQPQMATTSYLLPPPASIGAVLRQANHLADNDVVGDMATAGFVAPEVLADALSTMAGTAGMLVPFTTVPISMAGSLAELGSDLARQMAEAPIPELPGAAVTVLRGEAISGPLVDGVSAEAVPDFRDSLPEALAARLELDEAAGENTTAPADPDQSSPDPGADDPAESGPPASATVAAEPDDPAPVVIGSVLSDAHGGGRAAAETAAATAAPHPEGHQLTTGENLAINESYLYLRPVDAPTILVMGDHLDLTAISQINLISDRDFGSGQTDPASVALNGAEIGSSSAPSARPDGPATGWSVTEIDGDLTQLIDIVQTNYIEDFDRISVTLTATTTELTAGANRLSNLAEIQAFNQQYDVIVVAGDYSQVISISQQNVLLDDDVIATGGGAQTLGADNLAMNRAVISRVGEDRIETASEKMTALAERLVEGGRSFDAAEVSGGAFDGLGNLAVLVVQGDLYQATVIEQRNVVGDADQIAMSVADAMAAAAEQVATGQLEISAGANALLNAASLTERGMDSDVFVKGDSYSDEMIHQAGLIDTDAMPAGVFAQVALASEAVAFLAEDMIAKAAEMEEHISQQVIDGMPSADVMQTVTG
ncbi:hypothetical protein [Frigidibacter sp. ROC022]|uniref:hypothetical protein n=1 Tax=Frigidibacter sp. ROC022 TaxID=2971796 RepID=UPI00215B3C1A|nr:hypothetical protein [Frigidibacter sp. ROC022]MCR8725866.1 hypothetical protein [Frigidibacter sp. ROC022]